MKVSLFSAAMHAYARLAPRERLLVQLGGAALAVTMLWSIGYSFQAARSRLEQKIRASDRQLGEMQDLRQRYLQLKQQTDTLIMDPSKRPADFSPYSFLQRVGNKAVGGDKIKKIDPDSKTIGKYLEESAELRLEGVTLPQVVNLLYEIENAPVPLRVARLQMKKRFNEPYNFDVTLKVSSIKTA